MARVFFREVLEDIRIRWKTRQIYDRGPLGICDLVSDLHRHPEVGHFVGEVLDRHLAASNDNQEPEK